MTKFRKRPPVIEIEAVQYLGGESLDPHHVPDWSRDAVERGTITIPDAPGPLVIRTLAGQMVVAPGDWLVKGLRGKLYPVKDAIFRAMYEPVGDDGAPAEWEGQRP